MRSEDLILPLATDSIPLQSVWGLCSTKISIGPQITFVWNINSHIQKWEHDDCANLWGYC
jgi:hypothetical protein